jgi:hypothetical protein
MNHNSGGRRGELVILEAPQVVPMHRHGEGNFKKKTTALFLE